MYYAIHTEQIDGYRRVFEFETEDRDLVEMALNYMGHVTDDWIITDDKMSEYNPDADGAQFETVEVELCFDANGKFDHIRIPIYLNKNLS
jgi:hypothetical protein